MSLLDAGGDLVEHRAGFANDAVAVAIVTPQSPGFDGYGDLAVAVGTEQRCDSEGTSDAGPAFLRIPLGTNDCFRDFHIDGAIIACRDSWRYRGAVPRAAVNGSLSLLSALAHIGKGAGFDASHRERVPKA